jgi:hypothetical protein
LQDCKRCSATWRSLQSVHTEFTALDDDIPEPDWMEFRLSVRNQLLARSVKRESAVRRWTGWAIRPALAWGLSVLLAVGITSGLFLWKMHEPQETVSTAQTNEPMLQLQPLVDVQTDAAVWSRTALFDDLLQLTDTEQEQLRQMIESTQKGMPDSQ